MADEANNNLGRSYMERAPESVNSANSDTAISQLAARFAFLKAVQELLATPIPRLSIYKERPGGWVHELSSTPSWIPGLAFWNTESTLSKNLPISEEDLEVDDIEQLGEGSEEGEGQSDSSASADLKKTNLLSIPKPEIIPAPRPPVYMVRWIDGNIEDPFANLTLHSTLPIDPEDETQGEEVPDFSNEDFYNWKIDWDAWAENAKQLIQWKKLYETAFDAWDKLKQAPEEWELVLGLGRLRLNLEENVLDRHLFTVNCIIDMDPRSGKLQIRKDEFSQFLIEDEWILDAQKPNRQDLEALKEKLIDIPSRGITAVKTSLKALALGYRSDLNTDAKQNPNGNFLIFDPALILRKRGQRELINMLNSFEKELNDGGEVPGPLRALVDPEFEADLPTDWSANGAVLAIEEDAYLPLKLNHNQIRALKSADTRSATLVQGPPGTGKTRTIAVMIAHFLAKGQRVLVTAETSQALREVRGQLPQELRDLVVSKVGQRQGSKDDLAKAINALNLANESRDELLYTFPEREKRLLAEIDKLHRDRAMAFNSAIELRVREATTYSVAGFTGSPAQLVALWSELRDQNEWISGFLGNTKVQKEFALNEASELLDIIQQAWNTGYQTPKLTLLPDENALLTPDDIATIASLSEYIKTRTSINYPRAQASEIRKIQEELIPLLRKFEAPNLQWLVSAINEILETGVAGNELKRIRKCAMLINNITEYEELNPEIFALLNCPNTSTSWFPKLDALSRYIDEHGPIEITATGAWKIPLLGGRILRDFEDNLGKIRFKGLALSTLEDIERIKGVIELDLTVKSFFAESRLTPKIDGTPNRHKVVSAVLQFRPALSEFMYLHKLILQLREALGGSHHLTPYSGKIDLLLLDKWLDGEEAKERLNSLGLRLSDEIKALEKLSAIKEARDHLEALLSKHDQVAVNRTFTALKALLDTEKRNMRLQKRASNLLENNALSFSVVEEWMSNSWSLIEQQAILQRVQSLPVAMRWKLLEHELQSKISTQYGEYFNSISDLDFKIEQKVRELARRRAWHHALVRIKPTVLQAMSRYEKESRGFGKTGGKLRNKRIANMKEYLKDCTDAIPAWIMPIREVAQSFPAKLASFDVVIVDEASQASLSALFLLGLGHRIVVVGDHKQVSPDIVGRLNVEAISELGDRYLTGDSCKFNWQNNPNISLFDECRSAFGTSMITLTEHRRCVPEIIGFSNQIAYDPDGIRLVPVRQPSLGALRPIETHFVPDGYVEGSADRIHNRPEAEAIATRIVDMVNDKRYAGLTIGVITLQGTAQAELIRQLVSERLSPEEYEARQLMFGNPPSFQGAERNIILLSLVAANNQKKSAQTRETMVQRYNVAASRAKDQLILFHSVRSIDLPNPEDMRKRLLEYCEASVARGSGIYSAAVGLVSEEERTQPFDSLFEQRVHNRIVERGYMVVPQFEPEIEGHDYKIDLLVVGPFGRVAVECDGDYFHCTPEAIRNDFLRQSIITSTGLPVFRILESDFYANADSLNPLWEILRPIGKPGQQEMVNE